MNFTARIREEAGHWIKDEEGIKNSATQYFAKLFALQQEGRSQTANSCYIANSELGRKWVVAKDANIGGVEGSGLLDVDG